MDDILRTSFHNVQKGNLSVLFNVVQQVMLNLLRKDEIGEKLDVYIAKF